MKSKEKCITHRCKKLLNHNKIHMSNRIIKYMDLSWRDDGFWHIESLKEDLEWDTEYMSTSAIGISFCPFCGERLEDVEETD